MRILSYVRQQPDRKLLKTSPMKRLFLKPALVMAPKPLLNASTADSNPAIIEKLTNDLTLEDEKGPDINTQLAGLVRKLLRKAKPNETKLNELKKQYISPSNCQGLSETRVNSNIWNNLGETARSNDLKLQKVEKYLMKGTTAVVTVTDSVIRDESNSSKEDNIGKLVDAVILLANEVK